MIDDLFKEPYDHSRWLKDQEILINRMKNETGEFWEDQVKILEGFQNDNQCSIIMIDIIKERLTAYDSSSGDSSS